MNIVKIGVVLVMCGALAACQVATQNIPVSTNPTGALVYADGTEVCTAPCNVTLETTQPHILTFKKEGYKQVDVQITQKYDTAGVARASVGTGMQQSSWGANTEGAVANALLTAGAKEQDGTAYVLSPSSVVVRLQPEGQASQVAQSSGDEPITIDSSQLDSTDRKKLFGNDDAQVQTTEPVTMESAAEEDPAGTLKGVLEGAAVAAPTISGKTKLGGSSSSHTTMDGPGSMTKTTTKTSVGASVSVNPVEAGLGVLNLLEGASKDKESGAEGASEE